VYFMDCKFNDNEKLLRAVLPPNRRPDFWENGRLSSAALKDKNGLSVERTYDRTMEASISHITSYLKGYVVSITVPACRLEDACLRYEPTSNIYHCEIHGSETEVELSDIQALLLARGAVLEFEPNAEYKV